MFLKNNAKRLITINGKLDDKGERLTKYQVLPGNNPSVEVPDELCESDYVKTLMSNGDLVQVQGDPTKPDLPPKDDKTETQGDPTKPDLPGGGNESLYADFDKSQLIAQCEARDIKVSSRDTVVTLTEKLEAADE